MKRFVLCLLVAACGAFSAGDDDDATIAPGQDGGVDGGGSSSGAGPSDAADQDAELDEDSGGEDVQFDAGPPVDSGTSSDPPSPLTLKGMTANNIESSTLEALTLPGATITGDLLIAVGDLVVANGVTINGPSGWVETNHIVTTQTHHTFVWMRQAVVGTATTVSSTGSMNGGVSIAAFSGAGGAVFVSPVGYSTSNQINIVTPPRNNGATGDFYLIAYASDADAIGVTLTPPSGFTGGVQFVGGNTYGLMAAAPVQDVKGTGGLSALIHHESGQKISRATATIITVKD